MRKPSADLAWLILFLHWPTRVGFGGAMGKRTLVRLAAKLICEYDQRVPATTLRLNSPDDETMLAQHGVQLAPGVLMKNARVVTSGDLSATLLSDNKIAIQDEGSQLIAALVGDGQRILDCCAAPGGKTAAMANRLPSAEIIATELHPHRATLLRKPGAAIQRPKSSMSTHSPTLARPDFDRVLS